MGGVVHLRKEASISASCVVAGRVTHLLGLGSVAPQLDALLVDEQALAHLAESAIAGFALAHQKPQLPIDLVLRSV